MKFKTSDLYYIQDARSYVGNSVLFWRPGGAGYTTNLDEAGLYTLEEASSHRDTDIPIPFLIAHACISREVHGDTLRAAMPPKQTNGSRGDKPVRKP